MIVTCLLLLIYLGFVSLGLPDGLTGVAWPLIYLDFDVPFSFQSVLGIPSTIGAVISSLCIGKILRKFRPVHVIFVSCFLTGLSLIGFSFARETWMLLLLNIPYGLGAGGVDATLNDYVSKHFSARHMNWLHASYGIGATIGPFIMTMVIASTGTWRLGHRTVGSIQILLGIIFILTIFLWKKADSIVKDNSASESGLNEQGAEGLSRPYIRIARLVLSFAIYTGMEAIIVCWLASFFSLGKGYSLIFAGKMSTLFLGSFVVGRILSGIVVEKLSLRLTITMGSLLTLLGIVSLLLSGSNTPSLVVGVVLLGLGCAPIFPCMMQQTPLLVPKKYASSTIGYQMAGANVAYLLLPYSVGLISEKNSILLFPIALLIVLILFVSIKVVPEYMKRR